MHLCDLKVNIAVEMIRVSFNLRLTLSKGFKWDLMLIKVHKLM